MASTSQSSARVEEARAALKESTKSVQAYSRAFASGQAPVLDASPAKTAAGQDEDSQLPADEAVRELLKELTQMAKDLRGRCVGRNADDAETVYRGLERLRELFDQFKYDQEGQLAEARRGERDAVRAFVEAKAERDRTAEEEQRNRAVWLRAATHDGGVGGGSGADLSAAAATLAELERAAEERVAEAEAAASARCAAVQAAAAEQVALAEAAAAERLAAAAEQVAVAEAAAADLAQKLAAAEEALDAAGLQDSGSGGGAAGRVSRVVELEAEVQEARRAQLLGSAEGQASVLRELADARTRLKVMEAELQSKALAAVSGLVERLPAFPQGGAAAAAAAAVPSSPTAAAASLLAAPSGLPMALSAEQLTADASSAATAAAVGDLAIVGNAALGGTLRVASKAALAHVTFQWLRAALSGTGAADELIAGATRHQYAPEPLDVGRQLLCSVVAAPGEPAVVLAASSPVAPMEGLDASLAVLRAKPAAEFNVVVVQRNGEMQDRREVHQLEVLPSKLKLKRAGRTRYKEDYTAAMQVCGARGGGDAAAQGLFLALGPHLVFMLACESARQRNAAIMLIRHFAAEKGLSILGPKDMQS